MRIRWVIAMAAAVLMVGCGIPEEEHKRVLDNLKKLTADMAAAEKACAEEKDARDKKIGALSAENDAFKAKLVALGQDVSALRTKAGQMVEDLTAKQKQIAELLKAQEAARKRAEMYRNLVSRFQSMISSGKLKVSVRKGRMIVQMSDKILFDPGKDKLKKEGKEALVEVARILATIPDRHFQVAGHTDNVPIKTRRFKSNWELSTARAVNVVKFMGEQGMDSARLSAAGYGPYDPVGDNSTDDGRQLNRRIEITLMPSIEELPKFD